MGLWFENFFNRVIDINLLKLSMFLSYFLLFSVATLQLWNCIPLKIKKSKSAQSFRKKIKNIFRPSFSTLNPLCPGMLEAFLCLNYNIIKHSFFGNLEK